MLVLLSIGLGSSACAAVPVEEASQPQVRSAANSAAAPAAAPQSNARLSELFFQIQTMQQELRELRGTVEEQQHLIDRLKRDQKEQYQNLDSRLLGLGQGRSTSSNTRGGNGRRPSGPLAGAATGAATGANVAEGQPQLRNGEVYLTTNGSQNPAPDSAAANSGAAGAGTDERAAYTAAFDQMKARQFDESISSFNRLIVAYPGGVYTGHAFYWLGELYLAKGNDNKARQQFLQVVDVFPDHSKVPDALYKMGVATHRMGDSHKALEYLNRTRAEHPGSNAAKLAADYAKEMQ